MLKRWIEHHYLKREFQRLESERQEIEQRRQTLSERFKNRRDAKKAGE